MLTALLMQPVANLGATEADKDDQPEMCDITVADILGPPLKEVGTGAEAANCSDRERDANFSLLSYSFSLVGRAPAATSNSALLMGPAAKQGCSRVTHTAYMWRMLELYNADGRFVALAMSPPYINAPPTCLPCRTRRFATSSASRWARCTRIWLSTLTTKLRSAHRARPAQRCRSRTLNRDQDIRCLAVQHRHEALAGFGTVCGQRLGTELGLGLAEGILPRLGRGC